MLTYNGTTIGKITIEQEIDDEKHKFDLQIRQGNCLAVVIYVRKATKEELEKNPKGKWYHQLYTFFVDEQHMKNIMKDYSGVMCDDKVVKCELNLYYKECWTLLKYFVKSGYDVKCYYKEPKKK
jgi:hypothetical protein